LKADGPKRFLNSECRVTHTYVINKVILLGINQNVGVNKIRNIIDLIQFMDEFNKDEDGSNTENKLVIIIFN
jgi:hypothetical protein